MENYLAYGDLLQQFDGKPLLTIIDGASQFTPADRPLNTTQWTLRWVASQVCCCRVCAWSGCSTEGSVLTIPDCVRRLQLQNDRQAAANGYWSWMCVLPASCGGLFSNTLAPCAAML